MYGLVTPVLATCRLAMGGKSPEKSVSQSVISFTRPK